MPIAISCPGCGHDYELSESMLGRTVRCKHCRATFPVSRPRPAAAAVGLDPSELYGLDEPVVPESDDGLDGEVILTRGVGTRSGRRAGGATMGWLPVVVAVVVSLGALAILVPVGISWLRRMDNPLPGLEAAVATGAAAVESSAPATEAGTAESLMDVVTSFGERFEATELEVVATIESAQDAASLDTATTRIEGLADRMAALQKEMKTIPARFPGQEPTAAQKAELQNRFKSVLLKAEERLADEVHRIKTQPWSRAGFPRFSAAMLRYLKVQQPDNKTTGPGPIPPMSAKALADSMWKSTAKNDASAAIDRVWAGHGQPGNSPAGGGSTSGWGSMGGGSSGPGAMPGGPGVSARGPGRGMRGPDVSTGTSARRPQP
jgi:hypothetical protein